MPKSGKELKKVKKNLRENHGIKFLSFLSLKRHLGLWCTWPSITSMLFHKYASVKNKDDSATVRLSCRVSDV